MGLINFKKKNIFFLFVLFLNIFFLSLKKEKFKVKERAKTFNKIKVCICTYGKNENRYIREFIQHYEKYDVDKI